MAFLSSLVNYGNKALDWYKSNPIVSDVLVPGALSLYNTNQQKDAISGATGQRVAGIEGGLSTLNQFYKTAQGDAAPYMAGGLQGLGQYQGLLANPNAIKESEDYKFRFGEGQQALERSAAAKGMLLSGNTLQDLQQYGQGFATRELDAALQRRIPLIETGLTAHRSLADLGGNYARAIAGLYGDRGEALAQGTLGRSDATTGTLSDTLSILEGLGKVKNTAESFGTNEITDVSQIQNGLSLPNIGTIPYSDLLAAGGGTAAGALQAANMIAKDTAMGAKTWADLSMGPNKLAGSAANATAGNALGKVTSFLQTAPGMGIAAGLINGIATGDWGKAATTGLGTAAGAKLGSMVLPGIGTFIGGALGGLLGGSIGPKPSDRPAETLLNLNAGTWSYGEKNPSPETKKAVLAFTEGLSNMSKTVKSVFPEVNFDKELYIQFGERDGLRINGTRYNDANALATGAANAFIGSMGGVPANIKDAISRVDFSNQDLAKQQLQYIRQTMMA